MANKVIGIFLPLHHSATFNPNSHGVGHIGPTLFWRQIAQKNVKCEKFLKIS
jgi:hypothetical protein